MSPLLHDGDVLWAHSFCPARLGPHCPFPATWLNQSVDISLRSVPIRSLPCGCSCFCLCIPVREIGPWDSITQKRTRNSVGMSLQGSDDSCRTSMVWHLEQEIGCVPMAAAHGTGKEGWELLARFNYDWLALSILMFFVCFVFTWAL